MREYFKIDFKNDLFYGVLHALIAFTSIVVVSSILGFPLTNSFLFAGIGTLVFKLITKNKIPMVLGISGSFIGSMLVVDKQYGREFVLGGVIASGVIFVILGLLMFKFQDKILKYIDKWILNVAVILISLNLLPIGRDMVGANTDVAFITILILVFCNYKGNKYIKMLSVPISIMIGTLFVAITTGLDFSVLNQNLSFEFVTPKFNLSAILTIGLVSVGVLGEILGDTANTSSIVGKDFNKEVGIGRILIGNGLASIISGCGSSSPNTSYGENSSLLLISGYHKPNSQIYTALFFILISLFTPLLKVVMLIPSSVLGAIALYLYAMFCVNSIKELSLNIDLAKDTKKFTITTLMIAVFFMNITIFGVGISSIATAILIGIGLNVLIKDEVI